MPKGHLKKRETTKWQSLHSQIRFIVFQITNSNYLMVYAKLRRNRVPVIPQFRYFSDNLLSYI